MNTKTPNSKIVLSFHMQALKTNFFFTILFGITLLLPNISKAQTFYRVDYISGQTSPNTAVSATSNNDITSNAPTTGTRVYSYFYNTNTQAEQINANIKSIVVYNVPTGISGSTITRDTVLFVKSTDGSYPIYNVKTLRALSTFVMKDVNGSSNNTSSKTFKLLNDITFTDNDLIWNWNGAATGTYTSNFLPIGYWGDGTTNSNTKYFAGTFEGIIIQ
jgi:hypothetical protein